jgi:hypothetical protein
MPQAFLCPEEKRCIPLSKVNFVVYLINFVFSTTMELKTAPMGLTKQIARIVRIVAINQRDAMVFSRHKR